MSASPLGISLNPNDDNINDDGNEGRAATT